MNNYETEEIAGITAKRSTFDFFHNRRHTATDRQANSIANPA